MTRVTQAVGALLIAVGIVAYLATGAESLTALLPALLGAALLALGLLATRDALRPHAIHGALVVALLGLLGTLPNVAELPDLVGGDVERPGAVVASTLTALCCALFLGLGVRSFVAARRQQPQP
ncbi:MAG TPA: hypothetical protein VG452_06060 [Egibacteraceae bacterium]|nr:hypothetical protein [Egibacteraceae bacterium]